MKHPTACRHGGDRLPAPIGHDIAVVGADFLDQPGNVVLADAMVHHDDPQVRGAIKIDFRDEVAIGVAHPVAQFQLQAIYIQPCRAFNPMDEGQDVRCMPGTAFARNNNVYNNF